MKVYVVNGYGHIIGVYVNAELANKVAEEKNWEEEMCGGRGCYGVNECELNEEES